MPNSKRFNKVKTHLLKECSLPSLLVPTDPNESDFTATKGAHRVTGTPFCACCFGHLCCHKLKPRSTARPALVRMVFFACTLAQLLEVVGTARLAEAVAQVSEVDRRHARPVSQSTDSCMQAHLRSLQGRLGGRTRREAVYCDVKRWGRLCLTESGVRALAAVAYLPSQDAGGRA